ncbi:hypothetical protein [Lacinutrix salivirga]
MKLKFAFKILLLIGVLAVFVLLAILMFNVLFVEQATFEWTMAIPFLLMFFASISAVYHFKTLPLYSRNPRLELYQKLPQFLLILNLVFAVSIIGLATYLGYTFYTMYSNKPLSMELNFIIYSCVIPLIFGSWLLVEHVLLHKRIKAFFETNAKDSIDDISGFIED